MNRCIRRHNTQRIHNKRKHYWNFASKHPTILETPACCSCYMCGNPRKQWKSITKQERLANLITREYDVKGTPEYGSLGYY